MTLGPKFWLSAVSLSIAVTAHADPLGSSSSAAAASAKQIQLANSGSGNGFYWFDPDGAGAGSSFMTYADMNSAGGGWMLGMHSINGSEAPSTDMTQNLGVASLSNGFTRDLSYWAVDQAAQIRHRIVATTGAVLFDGYYTGKYHDPLGSSWTVLAGSLAAAGLNYHVGRNWSTATNDIDTYSGNCAASYGNQPWYYGACWMVNPTGYTWTNGPMGGGMATMMLASYDIYVRELQTPPLVTPVPEPETYAMLLGGLGLLAVTAKRRRRQAAA